MNTIHEEATLTSKGQVTLPKSIRQALGVSTQSKIAFDLRDDGQIIVSRVESGHHDPAISAFLERLESDIRNGKNVGALPAELAEAMLANVNKTVDLDEDIEGEVAL
jgi:antitoxin PrlF